MTEEPGVRRRVGEVDLAILLRRLGARDRLVALVGDWDDGRDLVAYDPVRRLRDDEDPFDLGTGPDGAREAGTWIGWWGYRLGARLEPVGTVPPRPQPLPDADLALYDTVLRRTDGQWWFESYADPDEAERRWQDLAALLAGDDPGPASYALEPFETVPGLDAHREAVRHAVGHVHAGDIFQANVCLRLRSRLTGSAAEMFAAGVEALHPAYAAYVAGSQGSVVSFSPELYLRRRGDHVLSSPIKGTAPGGSDPAALAASGKDRAENVMIVDLVRNDLGRVARTGSVQVRATASPRPHTGVWHLVSDVEARLLPGTSDADVLRASFPPGSVTGAPKVRAMQLIGELEATGREVYTGAIGYAGPGGFEANVAIRTFEIRGEHVWLGVGGGVVADSDPDAELRECFTKAAPLLRAVGAPVPPWMVEAGAKQPPWMVEAGAEQPPWMVEAGAKRRIETTAEAVSIASRLDQPGGQRVDQPGGSRVDHPSGSRLDQRGGPRLEGGIFDTLLVRDGVGVDLDGHVARFVDAARTTYGISLDQNTLAARVEATAAGLTGPHRLRLTLDPATAAVDVTAVPAGEIPTGPWTLHPRVVPGGLGDAKWSDRSLLERLPGAPWGPSTDPLLVDDGAVLETGRGNVFVVRDDGVHTPALDGRILPGVTRAVVLDRLRSHGIPVYERRIGLDELRTASELFVTNAIGRIRGVAEVDGVASYRPGPVTGWLAQEQALDQPAPPASIAAQPRVLLIDNYDSFVHNLAQYLRQLGAHATVVRNDAITPEDLRRMRRTGELTHLVVSPGPGAPRDAGVSVEAVRALGPTTPTLGVCLGHQAIGEAYGARVVRAPRPVHGSPSLVHHDGEGVYARLGGGPLVAARYHSLVLDDLPDSLVPTAWNGDGVLMGVRHREHPVEGVQIHPESILTPRGHDLLAAFLSPAAVVPARS